MTGSQDGHGLRDAKYKELTGKIIKPFIRFITNLGMVFLKRFMRTKLSVNTLPIYLLVVK